MRDQSRRATGDSIEIRQGQSEIKRSRANHRIQRTCLNVNRKCSALNSGEVGEVGNKQQHPIDGTLDFPGKVVEQARVRWFVLLKHVRHKSDRCHRIL